MKTKFKWNGFWGGGGGLEDDDVDYDDNVDDTNSLKLAKSLITE